MVFWRIVGIIVSILVLMASVIVGIFFFGILAVALAGLAGLFILLWLLFYLNRKWRHILFVLKERFHRKDRKKKGKRHWEHHEEIIVKEVREEKA